MSFPLDRELDAAGAHRGTWLGTVQVLDFGDTSAEYASLRRGCGVLDAGFRSLFRLVGEDRVTFLQGMVSNDVKRLGDGEGLHAAMLTVQGRVVSDLRVYGLADALWIDVPAPRATTARETLGRYIVADDVEIEDVDLAPVLALEGPATAAVCQHALGIDLTGLAPLGHAPFSVDGASGRVVRVSHAGEQGALCLAPRAAAPALWLKVRQAGAMPVGLAALDVARVEAGIPWVGIDMDESHLAPEVGLADAISFRKGCYIGQEVVERVAARGQVQRKLTGIVLAGDEIPDAAASVLQEGKEVGEVTSAVRSPAFGCAIALAYVRRSAWERGTNVEVVLAPDRRCAATVADLPFLPPTAVA